MQMRDGCCRYLERMEIAIARSRVAKVIHKHEWIFALLAVLYGVAGVWVARALGVAFGVTFGTTLA